MELGFIANPQGNLLSFKDICKNGYHIETMNGDNIGCLYIASIVLGKKLVMEKLLAFSYGLYHTNVKPIKSYVVVNQKFKDPKCDAPNPGVR